MKAIIEMLGSMNFRGMRKRAIASALALLMIVSMVPAVWIAANAADSDYICGLEEHAHSAECYAAEASCGIPEGEQYEIHAHTDDCTSAEPPCELEEGASVLVGNHTHSAECYALVCGKTEHTHTAGCEVAKKNTEPADDGEEKEIELLAEGAEEATGDLSVTGVWDTGDSAQGHENIAFGSSTTATIEHGDDYQSEEISVRVTANFPEDATDRKLKIELAEGLEWISNGESTILKEALDSVSGQSGKSTIYNYTLNNGSFTYSFKEGVASASVTIRVKKSVATNFASINDAIKATVTCTQNGEALSATSSLKNLECEQFSHIGHISKELEKTVKAEEIAYNYGFVLTNYDTVHLIQHRRLYDFAEVTVTVPKGVVLNNADVNHSGSGGISDVVVRGWKLVSTDGSAADVTKYTIRTNGVNTVAIGSTFEWIFPEELAGQRVLVEYSNITWKLYGDETVYSLPENITRKTYFNVVPSNTVNEIVVGDNIFADFRSDSCSPDAVYRFGGFVIQNKGSDDSVPKIVEYSFDEKLGITNVSIYVDRSGTATVKVWYKIHGDDTWYEKNVTKKMTRDASETLLGRMDITNLDLGLSADTYLSALKYEYDDLADDNGTPDDTTDDIRIGIPAGKKSVGFSSSSVNTGAHNPFAGINLGLSTADPTAVSTVTIRDKYEDGTREPLTYTVTTTYKSTPENYMYLVGDDVHEKNAGESFTVSVQLSANWAANSSQPYSVGFTQYPIIYIRDETGVGISNIKLTNLNGVDIISKYPNNVSVTLDHTETVDHNGDGKFAKVYKIDTSGLSMLTSKEDRYAAAVGFWDNTATKYKLVLSYTIYTPGTYDDGGVVHKLSEAIFLSDPLMSKRSNKSNGSIVDPYDVDNDGITSGDKDIFQTDNKTDNLTEEYTISPSADITVAAAVKKTSDGGSYTTWDGSDSYVQIQSGEVYNVRNSVYNGSGVTTSTEDGKKTVIYIPVPKKGDQWGQANSGFDKDGNALTTFAYDMTLSGAVSNPDPAVFTISYGNVDTSGFGANDDAQRIGTLLNAASGWNSSYSDSTNCVRIIVSGMEPSETLSDAKDIILPLVAEESARNREVNIFSAIYYEDITNANGNTFKLWKYSDKLALQIAEGEISGRVWEDLDGNGIQDENEPGVASATVTLEGTENRTATTNADGEYVFEKLAVGDYTVTYDYDETTYAVSPKEEGSSTSIDSNADDESGKAVIADITIPTVDGMGKTTYTAADLDIGLAPIVTVEYEWSGDIPTGVTLPEADRLTSGIEYTAETVDTVTGYTFDGWYTDEALSESFASNTVITEDTTLYGKWTIKKYDVTYAWNDAPSAAVLPESDNVPYGTAYNAKAPAAVNGYTFDGWYTDEACTTAYTDGTAVTDDITIYGKWTRNTVDVEGSVNWVENGEGFDRPDTVTVNLMQNGTKVDSADVTVDDKASQSFTFTDLPEYSEDGTVKYEYTVAQETVPTNYVETVSGCEIVNTYNVNKYYITVEWDHTGAPAAEKVTEATVILNRDGEGYKTATLTEATPTATTTIARPEAAGHTFSIEQNAIPGYETTYSEPVSVDTDNDGEVDAVTYTVRNTYIMPKTSVSGDIEWVDVPDGETVPDITVNLMLNGKVVDTVEIPAGNPTYQFTNLDRYNADGTPAEYTVEVEAIPSYSTAYSDAETDEDGNRTISITNTGEFEYGSLTVRNTVVGGDDEFTFTVTVGKKTEAPQAVTYAIRRAAAVQYPYSGTYSGTITAGEPTEFTLKNGEYITIENMLVGVNYTIAQKAHPDYYTTPADLTASGAISADDTVENFVNSKIPTGSLSITTKVTGSGADKNTIFEYKVTIDSEDSFQYTIGETTGTLKSGDVLRLKHGETAVIVGIKEGTSYTVTQVADLGYKMTSTGASGKVTAQGITASFINTKEAASGGSNVPDTGDYSSGTREVIAIYVMQTAMLMMLFCAWQMKRRKENEEA